MYIFWEKVEKKSMIYDSYPLGKYTERLFTYNVSQNYTEC